MEKETPVTAEDFYHSQAEFNRWLRDLMPHEKSHLKYMLEEYASIRAEQARQEERARYAKLRSFAKEIMRNHRPNSREYQDAKEALAAAGYEGNRL